MEQMLIAGCWQPADDATGGFRAIDPADGHAFGPEFPRSDWNHIDAAVSAAVDATAVLAATEPARIADFLERYAAGIETDANALVAIAHAETGLPASPRLLDVELPRTTGQLRQAAAAVRRYAWTQPTIDTTNGLRSHLAPLHKPVLVFGPNNFPFAFNAIAGSDFASAIAARNPVIAKAHPSHPGTSRRLAEIARQAVQDTGLPAASVQLLYEFAPDLGLRLAGDRRIGAIGFTGSRKAGLALKRAADATGIPIHAEMSSINPVFLLPGALRERSSVLAQDYFASCTMGSGQFCTNPGLVLVPVNPDGNAFVAAVASKFEAAEPALLFSRGVQQHLADAVNALRAAGAKVLAGRAEISGPGVRYTPTLLGVDATTFLGNADALQQEAFGPVSLLVRYDGIAEAVEVACAFEGNLTGSLHSARDGSDDHDWQRICAELRPRVGRLIDDKWPTGVAVSSAMNHGGPYPSTSQPSATSVGMPAAIRRFAALHCYDNVREDRLPVELRDHNPDGIQRMVDGRWTDASLPVTQ